MDFTAVTEPRVLPLSADGAASLADLTGAATRQGGFAESVHRFSVSVWRIAGCGHFSPDLSIGNSSVSFCNESAAFGLRSGWTGRG